MDIIGKKNMYFIISGVMMAIGFAFLIGNVVMGNGAFNYDVEFTGGTELSVDIGGNFTNEEITSLIEDAVGKESSPQVQKVVGTNRVNIKMKSLDSEQRVQLMKSIQDKYNVEEGSFEMNDMSAAISEEMRNTAVLAVAAACLGMLLYVSFRFRDVRTGGSAIIALLHDSILVILSYAVFRIPLNYSFIAVVLTILGFSINATIVIFDRIRENRKLLARPALEQLINISVGQTFKRCIYTSLTVLIVTASLYILGVPAIRDFTLPIMIGVVWGTYSSIFLSGSIFYVFMTGFKKAFTKA